MEHGESFLAWPLRASARLAALMTLAAALLAQPVLTLTGPASVASGQTATLTFSLSGTSGQSLAGVQWTLTPPSGLTLGAPVIGAPAASAGKGIYCNSTSGTCVSIGATNASPPILSSNPFTDGAVASIPATFGSTIPLGSLSLPLSSLLGASLSATAITIGSGSLFTLTVLPGHCDYTGDGKVDYQDVVGIIQALIGQASCSGSFAAGCSLKSLQAVVLAALGGACSL